MIVCDACGKKAHKKDRDTDISTVTIDFHHGEHGNTSGCSIASDTFELCGVCKGLVGKRVEEFIAGLLIEEAK